MCSGGAPKISLCQNCGHPTHPPGECAKWVEAFVASQEPLGPTFQKALNQIPYAKAEGEEK